MINPEHEISTIETLNHDNRQFVDARLRLVCDPKELETWEIMVMETGKVNDAMLIFARYLCKGETAVSPGLPSEPIDELTKADLAKIRNSKAFKALKRFKIAELNAAIHQFIDGVNAGF